jgi:hypothetical protein
MNKATGPLARLTLAADTGCVGVGMPWLPKPVVSLPPVGIAEPEVCVIVDIDPPRLEMIVKGGSVQEPEGASLVRVTISSLDTDSGQPLHGTVEIA